MTQPPNHNYPDHSLVPSEVSLQDDWNSAAVAELIQAKNANGSRPAFLYLGRREASLLHDHLASAFGKEAVANLKGTYYMGLLVVTIACDSFIATGGRKTIRNPEDQTKRPEWRDRQDDAIWQLLIR